MQEQQIIIKQAQDALEELLSSLPVSNFLVTVSAIRNTVAGNILFSVNQGLWKPTISEAASTLSLKEAKIIRAEKLEAEAKQLRSEVSK